jgi:hypothetical protein
VRGLAALVSMRAAGMVSYPLEAFPRDSGVRKAFQRSHPCPSDGKKTGACPGYVVDHIRRLEAAECRGRKSGLRSDGITSGTYGIPLATSGHA